MKEDLIALVFAIIIFLLTLTMFRASFRLMSGYYDEGVETYEAKDYNITYIILKDRLGDVIRENIMVKEE